MTTPPALRAAVLASLVVAGCAFLPGHAEEERDRLRDWWIGTWSSQSEEGGLDVRLVVAQVWTSRWDGPWLYAEEALAARPDRPHRQRIYRLSLDPAETGTVVADVFEIPGDPRRFAGTWRDREPFSHLRPEDLVRREGCSLRFHSHVGRFTGATQGTACRSERDGARYATCEMTVEPERIESWERGFDAGGRQVWGPVDGPDLYLRKSLYLPSE